MEKEKPILVAIYCMVYNHAPYLRKCFEGFMMQKTDFRFVAVIHDDCSTDDSANIIREYAAKYPDVFIPIYESENQYSKHNGAIERMMSDAINATGCKYVAFCEGDDYWTDPYKLQKQVYFMESHPEYSVTFHRCKHLDIETGEMHEDDCRFLFTNGETGVDVDLELAFKHWFTQPLTMLYRASCWKLNDMIRYKFYRDVHQIYHLLKNGKGYIFSFEGGVRTMHTGGAASQRNMKQICDESIAIAKELYHLNRDSYTKGYYIRTLQWTIYSARQCGYNQWPLAIKLFGLNHDARCLVKNLIRK